MIQLSDDSKRVLEKFESKCFPWDDDPSNNNRWIDGEHARTIVQSLLELVDAQAEALAPALSWDAEDEPWKTLLINARKALARTTEVLKGLAG